MKSLRNAVSKLPRDMCHAAVLFAIGCSSGMGDSGSSTADPSIAQDTQDLRSLAHRPRPPISHFPHRPPPHHPPPHHPGQGSGSGSSSGSSGTAGAFGAGGSTGSAGTASGPGGDSSSGGAIGAGGAGGFGGDPIVDVCGDGVKLYKDCDDGNTVSGDGCSSDCVTEPGYTCPDPGQACRLPRCGDGFTDTFFVPGDPASAGGAPGDVFGTGGSIGAGGAQNGTWHVEGCDDGNAVAGDGCSATCEVEDGFICPSGAPCREPRCGDGFQDPILVPGSGVGGVPSAGGAPSDPGAGGAAGAGGFYSFEGCDDGNTVAGDGCDESCTVESGYVCEQPDTPCRAPRCGDGVVDYYYPGTDFGTGGVSGSGGSTATAGAAGASAGAGGAFAGSVEQCDDGNTVAGDGCSATCQAE